MRLAWAAAPLLGAATALGFAPFGQHLLPFLTLALLFLLWRRAPGPLAVAGLGFAWGLGFFLAGVSWVYVSLHDVGGMAAPLAAIATLLFCAYLALYPALAGYLFGRWRSGTALRDAALAAGAWALADWLRGWVLTGFPWLAIGYSQVPDGLLAGFSPLLGVYGVGLLLAFGAGLLAFAGRRLLPLGLAAALAAAGVGLRGLGWTDPVGEPLSVSLVQGNIPQSIKWEPDRVFVSIDAYTRLVADHPARLTVLPETAIPLIFDRIPREALQGLTRHGDTLIGTAVRTRDNGYTNGALLVSPQLDVHAYAKTHLVPFGEYIPPGFGWFFDLVRIPMSDFTAGPPGQPPLEVADQKLMPNICYEDLFGAEILRALPAATVLVNLSNTAWFGDSLAQPQHLQISQARALETGRPMLRATNTGMTASVLPNGRVAAVLPAFTAGALRVDVQGHTGRTPYAQVGDRLAVVLALLACLPAARRSRRGAGSL
jgi:apolipoprotein N-acyltransferase